MGAIFIFIYDCCQGLLFFIRENERGLRYEIIAVFSALLFIYYLAGIITCYFKERRGMFETIWSYSKIFLTAILYVLVMAIFTKQPQELILTDSNNFWKTKNTVMFSDALFFLSLSWAIQSNRKHKKAYIDDHSTLKKILGNEIGILLIYYPIVIALLNVVLKTIVLNKSNRFYDWTWLDTITFFSLLLIHFYIFFISKTKKDRLITVTVNSDGKVESKTNKNIAVLVSIILAISTYTQYRIYYSYSPNSIAICQELYEISNTQSIYHVEGYNSKSSVRNIYTDSHLENLSLLKYVEQIMLSSNKFTNADSIHSLSYLKDLRLDNNLIVDISGLKDLPHLTRLDLQNNYIIDISPLSKLNSLIYLDISSNLIFDLSPLQNLTNLEVLYLTRLQTNNTTALKKHYEGNSHKYDNTIAKILSPLDEAHDEFIDLSPLKNLKSLKSLYLNNNKLDDISALANLTNLTDLNLSKNDITDITTLLNLKNLLHLDLSNNKNLEDISALQFLSQLVSVDLSGCDKITDFTPLENNPSKVLITYP